MQTIKNVTQLLVGASVAKSAVASQVIDAVTDLADGEIAVVDPRNNVHLTTAGFPAGLYGVKLIQRSGTRLIHSDIIKAGSVKTYSITLPATYAATEQIDYIGYNGTTGSITDLLANNIYTVRMYIRSNSISGFMQQKIKEGFWKSGSVAPTQQQVAKNLVESLIKNYSREPVRDIRFERINSGAQADALGAATAALAYNSNTVVFSADMTALVTAGTILRLGTSGAGTAPCYVVTGHNGGAGAARVYYLDIPWQGATTAALAAASVESVTEGNWGIQISGIATAYDGKFFGEPTSWKTTIDFDDAQTTLVTESQAASPGTGTYDTLARLEKELQADEYVFRNFVEGAPVDRTDIVSGSTYDVVVIEYEDVTESGQGVDVKSPKTLVIASEGNAAQADVAAIGWLTILNTLIPTTWATPGTAALTPTA